MAAHNDGMCVRTKYTWSAHLTQLYTASCMDIHKYEEIQKSVEA